MPQNPVNLDVVLTNARLKYPQYKNIPDDKLTKALIAKYPQYRNSLTPHGKAVADVLSGKHDPLGILDPQTSIKALRQKYPDLAGHSDGDLLKLLNGQGDFYLGERLVEDPTSTISHSPRPFTKQEIADMPKFMQEAAMNHNTNLALANDREFKPGDVAHEYPGGEIRIDQPQMFERGVMAHELTHAYQDMRTKEFTTPAADYEHPDRTYEYGGLPGLQQAIKDHKSISDFSIEQQAKMVEHYYDAHRDMLKLGKVSKDTANDFEEMKAAYGPFIKQLAGVPTDEDLDKPIGPPAPPGVPGYQATGYITGDKNIMDFMIPVNK